MSPTRLSEFLPLALQSLTQPRVVARQILAIPLTRPEIILAGWVVVVLNLLVSQVFTVFVSLPDPTLEPVSVLGASLVITVLTIFGGGYVLHLVGRAFGGNGSLDNCLKAIVWLNFVLLLVQMPVPILARLSPDIVAMATMLVLIVTMIQFTALVMELHGFTKVLPVLLGVLGAHFVFGLISLVVLQMMGVSIIPMHPV